MNLEKPLFKGVSKSDELKVLGLGYAALVGIGVAAINHEHGMIAAAKAGLLQASYKSVSALFILAIYEKLAQRGEAIKDELVTIGGVSAISIAINTAVHYFGGTQEIVLTMVPLGGITIVGTTAVHVRRRYQEFIENLDTI